MMPMDRMMLVSVGVLIVVPAVFVAIAALWQRRWTTGNPRPPHVSPDQTE